MADVFISYKRQDRAHAHRLASKLAALGFDVWWDFELLSGDRYRKVIERVIDECKAAIVLWSPAALESEFVLDEASYAHSMDKLCPAKIEQCRSPFGFGQLNVSNLAGWEGADDHRGFASLLRAIEIKTGKQATAHPPARSTEEGLRAVELEAFKAAQLAGSVTALRAFLAAFPEGAFARFVRGQVEAHSEAPASSPAQPARNFDETNYVFVSYPTDVAPKLLLAIVRELIGRGLSIWLYDPSAYSFAREELSRLRWQQSGGSWEKQTTEAITKASAVVALINEYSLQSRFQPREFELAVHEGKLLPCIVSDLEYRTLPPLFADLHAAKITDEMLSTEMGANRIAMLATDAEAVITARRERT
jgi:hypothetical protein